ncbi:MAG TPA: hypothetical protein VNU49_06800 [Opitutaceae bacterium]|jgi:hypothetical protein|nr:hypothetical protein [Opitutaceae bacterium]
MNANAHTESDRSARPPRCFEQKYGEQAFSLRIYFANGQQRSLSWPRYIETFFDGEKLQIVFAECEITVIGKNLIPVLDAICESRLECLRELPPEYGVLADDKTFVKKIEVRRRVEKET